MFSKQKQWIIATFAVTIWIVAPISFAKQKAGDVVVLQGIVEATPSSGQSRRLKRQSPIFENDVIETGQRAFAVLQFLDKTKLSLRANSIFSINQYRTAKGKENVGLELLKGGLRVLSGVIGKNTPRKFRIKGQRGQIGIRGTEFDVRECLQDCAEEQAKLLGVSLSEVNIASGLYAAVYDGGITGYHDTGVLNADAGQGLYFSEKGITLLTEIPLFLSQDPTPKASSVPDSTTTWADDYADDLELGALESPILQPIPVPGVESSGLPGEPIYEQQPEDAQGDFQPAPELPAAVTQPVESNTPTSPSPDIVDTTPTLDDGDDSGENNTPAPDPSPPVIIIL